MYQKKVQRILINVVHVVKFEIPQINHGWNISYPMVVHIPMIYDVLIGTVSLIIHSVDAAIVNIVTKCV